MDFLEAAFILVQLKNIKLSLQGRYFNREKT
jgi:hypothetical protein